MSLKNFRCFIWLLVLLFCILFVTSFVLVHQIDLLLSLVGNSYGLCSSILAVYFLYKGTREYYADRKRNGQKNPGQVVVRLPSSLTFYDYRIGGNSHTFHNQGFVEQRQARWRGRQFISNKNIITGLGLLAPGIKFIEYHLGQPPNPFPPGFWYTPIGLIWAYISLVIGLYVAIVFAVAYIRILLQRKNAMPETPQAVPSEEISPVMKNSSETRE